MRISKPRLAPAIAILAIALLATATEAGAQSQEEWIALGTRIHGGFGPLIPIGIRIGLDAREKLKPEPRGLAVLYYDGEKAPCPCIADGIMIATQASPGQGTLRIASEKAPAGLLAMIVIRNRRTGEGLRYCVSDAWLPKIREWIRTLDPPGRHDAVMKAENLFAVAPAP